jgi:hypothetical protein
MAKGRWISGDRSLGQRRFAVQKALIEKHFPCFACEFSRRHWHCEGWITPSEGCDRYRIVISYEYGCAPRARIKEPHIIPSAKIHMYSNGDLCLYEPADAPWKVTDNIHEKIIPWTAEWLVLYELFLICGKWLGPEAPHGVIEK